MSPLVPLVMFGWIPVVLYLFTRFTPQRAVIISFVAAWLFLPQASYPLPGLPDYTKMSATCYGILLATAIFDSGRFSRFRFGWVDIPMMVWCLAPFLASMSNGLGLYDGVAAMLNHIVAWGLPYFLGRLYIDNWTGLRQLAITIFAGGVAYSPLCLLETRISPQLHRMVYGFHVADFSQSIRFGGYRPTVFMQHGLAVGAWMMAATLAGIWLWKTGVLKTFMGISMKWWVPFMIVVQILVKSTGAYILLLLGVLALFAALKPFKTSVMITLIAILIVSYTSVAASGLITPEARSHYMDQLRQFIPADRVGSLEFRLTNEEVLGEKARERVIFGWGGWGRARIYDENGEDISVTDSLWIIAFGNYGLVGLTSFVASMLVPVLAFCWFAYPARTWTHGNVAPAAVLMVIVLLFLLDCVLNAMVNPVYTLTCGGISGVVLNNPAIQPRRRRRRSKSTPAKKESYALSR